MRLKALEIFTRGKPYFELIGQPGDGLSAEEVAQEVSELMGIMEPTYLQDSSDTGDKAQHYLLSAGFLVAAANGVIEKSEVNALVLFFILNREDFSFVIHLDRQPRTSRRREAQTGSRARSGSRSERTLDAVEHSRTLMEWWPFLIFHRGGLRIKVINNNWPKSSARVCPGRDARYFLETRPRDT